MEKTIEKTKYIKAKNVFRLVNQMWQSIEAKAEHGWKLSKYEINEDFTEAKIIFIKN